MLTLKAANTIIKALSRSKDTVRDPFNGVTQFAALISSKCSEIVIVFPLQFDSVINHFSGFFNILELIHSFEMRAFCAVCSVQKENTSFYGTKSMRYSIHWVPTAAILIAFASKQPIREYSLLLGIFYT